MSIIMGALGGAGAAMQDIYAERMKSDLMMEQDKQKSDRELDRQKALAVFKDNLDTSTANTRRTEQVGRINTAASGIADAAIQQKRGIIQSGIQDPGNWTSEQQDAVDQSLDLDKKNAMNDTQVLKQAAVSTGDMSIKDALADDSRQQGVEAKFANIDAKLGIAQMVKDAKDAKTDAEFTVRMAGLEARIGLLGRGNTDFDKRIALLREGGATDKDIANFITDKKQPSLEDLATRFLTTDPNAGSKKAMTIEDAYAKAKALRSLTSSIEDEKPTGKPANKPAAPEKVGGAPYPEGTVLSGPGGKSYVVKNGKPVLQ